MLLPSVIFIILGEPHPYQVKKQHAPNASQSEAKLTGTEIPSLSSGLSNSLLTAQKE